MKKIICLLLMFVICLSLFGCNEGSASETWSCFAEYDGIVFDPEGYIASIEENGGRIAPLTSWYPFDEEKTKGIYLVVNSDDSFFSLAIFEDVDAAKTAHKEYIEINAFEKAYNPYALAIRINNTVVFGGSDKENQGIIALAREIGIPEDQIKLQKNNGSWRFVRRDTDKSIEEMMQCIKDKGYTILDEYAINDTINGDPIQSAVYCIASEDYSAVYNVYMISGKHAKGLCYTTMAALFDTYPIIENACHVYYSLNDGCSMFILGVSAETRTFWDEIR